MWPDSKPAEALFLVTKEHELILSYQNIRELHDVVRRKAPCAVESIDVFLSELDFELVPAPEGTENLINDPKDQLILNAAIFAKVDIIISGDKHFLKLDLERPQTMAVAKFLETMELYDILNKAISCSNL